MSRYIDADKLKERLDLVSVDAITLYEQGINAGLHRAEAEIELLPTADVVEVRHGYNKDFDYPSLFECSVCGWSDDDTYTGDTSVYNYCPNCGAKMDGERREQ